MMMILIMTKIFIHILKRIYRFEKKITNTFIRDPNYFILSKFVIRTNAQMLKKSTASFFQFIFIEKA